MSARYFGRDLKRLHPRHHVSLRDVLFGMVIAGFVAAILIRTHVL